MTKEEILNKIRSAKLCLMAHPDNELDSEFSDRIHDLEEVEEFLISEPIDDDAWLDNYM